MCAWELHNPQQSQARGEILVGIPYKKDFSDKFFAAALSLKFPDYFAHSFLLNTGQPLDISRNIMVSNALQRNVSHLFFLDQDVICKADTIRELHESYMPIIGAVYYGRNPPYNVVANIHSNAVTRQMLLDRRNSSPNRQGLMEVHEIGMGATLIDTRVFKRIAEYYKLPFFCMQRHPDQLAEIEKNDTGIYYDWNEAIELNYSCKYCGGTIIAPFFDYRMGKYSENALSEDYYFCKLAREAGFSVYQSIHTEVDHLIHTFSINTDGLSNSTVSAGQI